MSTPQIEDGFTMIANQLMEAILRGGFSQRELLVLLTIMRKTYGYKKTEDDMSASQIGTMCGVARQHVTTTLNGLAVRNAITKRPGQYGMVVGIQKDHRKWVGAGQLKAVPTSAFPETREPADGDEGSPESGLVPNQDVSQIGTGGSPESGQVDSPDSGHTKENLPKENHQKKKSCAPQADRDDDGETPAGQLGRAMTGTAAQIADRFERFYAAYPHKRSRGTAEKAFAKLKPSEELLEEMLAALAVRAASGTWVELKFVPYPASWLNAKGWEDVVQAEYSPAEREVIEVFNETLGGKMGEASVDVFDATRAAQIREFLTFQSKPDLARRFFTWFRDGSEAPPHCGLDWLIGRKVYADAIQGRYTRK
jgi:phage replication O-like protein O